MVMLGGALGAADVGTVFPLACSGVAPSVKYAAALTKGAVSGLGFPVNAGLLSAVGVGLGYLVWMFIPPSATEIYCSANRKSF